MHKAKFSRFDRTRGDKNQIFRTLVWFQLARKRRSGIAKYHPAESLAQIRSQIL